MGIAISHSPPSRKLLSFAVAGGVVLTGGHMQRCEFITLLGSVAARGASAAAAAPGELDFSIVHRLTATRLR